MMTFKPATVIGWHKRLFKLYWRRKSRPGRPPVPPQVQALIRKMATENPAWQSGHIRDELVRLGYPAYDIKTIKKYIPNKLRESDPDRRARWLTFIRNHLSESWAIDFFTVPTWNFRFLYVFVVLEHGRRIVRHFNITANPTMLWVIQQLREATPWGEKPRFLFRDNDDIFDFGVLGFLEANDIEEVRTAYRSPWQNPYVERFIGTVRRELLDHVVVLGERHLGRLLREFVDDYYHPERPHQGVGLDGDAPIHRPVANATEGNSRIISKPILGGLHHRYRRVAA
jgi:transposase InsO family protein